MEIYQFGPDTRAFLEKMPVPVAVYQYQNNRINSLVVSEALLKLFGYDSIKEGLLYLNNDMYRDVHPEDLARVEEAGYRFAMQEGLSGRYDIVYRNKNKYQDSYHIIHGTGRHIMMGHDRLAVIIYTDETDTIDSTGGVGSTLKHALESHVLAQSTAHTSHYDDLTGLQNMKHFLISARPQIQEMWKTGKTPLILYFNMRNLKAFNNRFGFHEGDILLQELAILIRGEFGLAQSSRFESDHFVVYTELQDADQKLERLLKKTDQINKGNNLPLKVGAYILRDDGTSLSVACYRAKMASDSITEQTASEVVYFTDDIMRQTAMHRHVLRCFENALREEWIEVYYQPVIRTRTQKACGTEALVRWNDPMYGMISPGQFIPALEENGLVCQLDLYVVEQVCKNYRKLTDEGRSMVPASVNLSRKDLLHADLVRTIDSILERYNVPRSFINIEITESAFVEGKEQIGRLIEQFHNLGYKVWMDDFGSGYSSLGVLKDCSFDELKIDMSFLSNFTDKAQKILRSVVHMAGEIGIRTLAEGVETAEQYDFLKDIGCEKIQGYYFGRPMKLPEVFEYFQERGIQPEYAAG
jgi:diguanylate cyclase (GGDEF)-like protein